MAKLKVMTWNVWLVEKADNILSLIKEIEPDILCCQELTTDSFVNPSRNIPAEISKLAAMNYKYQQILERSGEQYYKIGNAIFSKLPIIDYKFSYIGQTSPDSPNYPYERRVYMEVKLKTDDKTLTVGTTHLSYSHAFKITRKRHEEFNGLIDSVKNHKERFVLPGDLNSLPNSRTIAELKKYFAHAGPSYNEPTWTTKPFSYQGFEASTLDWRIDYIFATRDIKILSSKTVKTEFSDHLPILAEIEI